MIKYLRDEKTNRKVGVIVAENREGTAWVGMAFLHPNDERDIAAENQRIKSRNALRYFAGRLDKIERHIPTFDSKKAVEIARGKMKETLHLSDAPPRLRTQVLNSIADIIVHTGANVVMGKIEKRKYPR